MASSAYGMRSHDDPPTFFAPLNAGLQHRCRGRAGRRRFTLSLCQPDLPGLILVLGEEPSGLHVPQPCVVPVSGE